MRIESRMAAPVFLAGLVAACSSGPREAASPTPGPSQPAVVQQAPATANPPMGEAAGGGGAAAELGPTQGNRVNGTITFAPGPDGVRVTAHIEGLAPGEHGFHLHQNGDCSAADGSSAGDHWNPTQQPHGAPDAPAHHAGDLGNVTADAKGNAHMERVVSGLRLSGAQSVIGRAVIVHGNADDLSTQPSGNAGPRVACGVVERVTTRPRDPGE
jgi:Cu-Zn family superoxide dismutase